MRWFPAAPLSPHTQPGESTKLRLWRKCAITCEPNWNVFPPDSGSIIYKSVGYRNQREKQSYTLKRCFFKPSPVWSRCSGARTGPINSTINPVVLGLWIGDQWLQELPSWLFWSGSMGDSPMETSLMFSFSRNSSATDTFSSFICLKLGLGWYFRYIFLWLSTSSTAMSLSPSPRSSCRSTIRLLTHLRCSLIQRVKVFCWIFFHGASSAQVLLCCRHLRRALRGAPPVALGLGVSLEGGVQRGSELRVPAEFLLRAAEVWSFWTARTLVAAAAFRRRSANWECAAPSLGGGFNWGGVTAGLAPPTGGKYNETFLWSINFFCYRSYNKGKCSETVQLLLYGVLLLSIGGK